MARRLNHPPSWAGYVFQLIAAGTFSTFAIAPLIKNAVLVLGGDDDPIVNTKNQLILHRILKRSELQIIDGAGHLDRLDSPEISGPIIESFLAQ